MKNLTFYQIVAQNVKYIIFDQRNKCHIYKVNQMLIESSDKNSIYIFLRLYIPLFSYYSTTGCTPELLHGLSLALYILRYLRS